MKELERIYTEMNRNGMDVALLCSYENVVYSSGFDTPLPYGAINDFGMGFPLSYVIINARNRSERLIVSNFYSKLAIEQTFLKEVDSFVIFDHFKPVDLVKNVCGTIIDILKEEMGQSTCLGIEESFLPAIIYKEIVNTFPDVRIKQVYNVIAKARRVKTERELDLMRKAAKVEDAGQEMLLKIARDFKHETEFEAWLKINEAMINVMKAPPVISGELVTGPRTNSVDYPNGPKDRQIEPGDMGLMDISTRVNGYWCDCSNVVVFGKEPNAEQKKYFKYVKDAYDAGFAKIKPGVKLSEVDKAASEAFEKNGVKAIAYTGHPIGCAVNESPRIVCYEDLLLEENMVLCIEPQQYSGKDGNTGARIEKVILVTKNGAEELNEFEWGI